MDAAGITVEVLSNTGPGPDLAPGAEGIAIAREMLLEAAVLDAAELDAVCLQHIGRFKRPKRYELVAALPKNNYGKVLKTELRERVRNP